LNVLFIPLAAAGAGLGIRLLQRFDPRPLLILGLTAVVSYTAPWIPYLAPGAVVAFAGKRSANWRWLAAAGLAFGLVAAAISLAIGRGDVGFPLSSSLAAIVTFAIGAWLADRIWRVVLEPERRAVLTFVVVAGICAPALTGALDLYLRTHTP